MGNDVEEFREAVKEYNDFAPFETIGVDGNRYTAHPVFVPYHILAKSVHAANINGWRYYCLSPRRKDGEKDGTFPVFFCRDTEGVVVPLPTIQRTISVIRLLLANPNNKAAAVLARIAADTLEGHLPETIAAYEALGV